MNVMKQFEIFSKYKDLRSRDVSSAIVAEISQLCGIPADATTIEAITGLIREGDEETVANYLGKPENLAKVKGILEKGKEELLIRCPHCRNLISLNLNEGE